MNELKLADLGEGMHEAEIVEWLVKVGESVKLDQPVVRVETDKAIVEIPSPVAGRVSEVYFQPGQVAKVGEVLVLYDVPQASNGDSSRERTHAAPLPDAEAPALGTLTTTNGASSSAPANGAAGTRTRVLAAPAVRKLAFELGVDLAEVVPSANGRVTIEDVRGHVAHLTAMPAGEASGAEMQSSTQQKSAPVREIPTAAPAATEVAGIPAEDQRVPLTGLRKRIAEHMERSWRTIPHATAFDEVDASELVALRRALLPTAEQRGTRLTYLPLLIKLLLPVLKEFPIFNASLDEEKREIIYKRAYHLGVAAASPEGLLVPVLRDADQQSTLEIAARLEKLIEGAKKRTLALNELSGSTFTLNNIGSFGGSSGTPIINSPEVAILAVGRIEEKAVARNGTLLAQMRMPLALSFDHRLIDGALAGAFLAHFKRLVEHPQQLLLDMR